MSSFTKTIRESAHHMSKIGPLCVCSMMLALRIVLGIFTNFTLSFMPFVKIGFSFLPIVIVAYLYGPVCACVVSGAGDILSIILNNPTAFSLMPGITLCYIIEGFILGMVLYKKNPDFKRISIAFILVLILCRLPLNTYFLYAVLGLPYTQLLLYRTLLLVPFAVLEVIISYSAIKYISKIPILKKI